MLTNEILIRNPINQDSIDSLFDQIERSEPGFLIIDFAEHNFESLAVLKELKTRFYLNEDILNKFKKIAFLHPAKFQNKSGDRKKYNYFTDRQTAVNWLNDSYSL